MPRSKKQKEVKQEEKIINLPISRFIDTKYRDYALYVVSSRGIPSFYDALTPVQRYILKNTPPSYIKTLSVVGESIKDGYHHGDCLDYDTEINLADGTSVTIGQWAEIFPTAQLLVKSIDEDTGEEKIGVGHSPRIGYTTDEYYEIEMENGEIFKCTPNHPFLVGNEWIQAKDLQPDMDIKNLAQDDI